MHFCAVIVHNKTLSVEEVRKIVGDVLVKRGEADWYSTDDYRERTFDGKVSIPFKEFVKKKDSFSVDEPLVFANIEDGYIDYLQIPNNFYEIFNHPNRKKILEMYNRAFYDKQMSILDEISGYDDVDDLIVTLLDYHN